MKNTFIAVTLLSALALCACSKSADTPIIEVQPSQSPERPERTTDQPQPIPAFSEISDVKMKKQAFFEYMNAKVGVANDDVWAERLYLLALQENFGTAGLSEQDTAHLVELADYYKLPVPQMLEQDYFEALLERIDVVPAALVLAQAANESAWGTSRFALQGRNFFGLWCFEKGCGIPPLQRNAGTEHEVHNFRSVLDGVRFYIHSINTANPYREVRELRAEVRQEDQHPTGTYLAAGLTLYSARGTDYVDEIRAMIRQNNLSRYSVSRSSAALASAIMK